MSNRLHHGWGLGALCGSVMMALVLTVIEPKSPTWWAILIFATIGSIAGVLILLWPPLCSAWRWMHTDLWSHYRLHWPIERCKGWPYEVDLASRIYHARTVIDFSNLETEHTFKFDLVFINTSRFHLQIDSVSGFTQYDALAGNKGPDIAWVVHGVSAIAPLDDFTVTCDQRVPVMAIAKLKDMFEARKNVSIMFSVRVIIRAIETNKTAEARLWHGINCAIPSKPVVIGKIVSCEISIPISNSALRVTT